MTKKKKEKEEKDYLSTKDIAELLGVDVRRVQQLTKEGTITGVKVAGKYTYDLFSVSKEYIAHLSKKVSGKEKTEKGIILEDEKLSEEIGIKKSKRKIIEMEVAELEGKLHNADDVKDMTTDLVLAIRSMLLAFPGRLSVDIIKCTAPEASEMIERAIHDVLDELSKYKYNPKEYRKRVMDSKGWLNDNDDD